MNKPQTHAQWVSRNDRTATYDTPDGTRVAVELIDNVACLANVVHIAEIREEQRAARAVSRVPHHTSYLFPLVPPNSDKSAFVGTVNADDHRPGLMPRTLEQAFGPGQRSSTTPLHIVVPRSQHIADKAVVLASALAGVFVLALLFLERITP